MLKVFAALAVLFMALASVLTNTTNRQIQASFDSKRYSLTEPSSIWVIVNKQHPLEQQLYAPSKLVAVGDNQKLTAPAATALKQLLAAANKQGLQLDLASGYRSYDQQKRVYDSEVSAYGQTVADTETAKAGYSEHQTGLAMDFGSGGCKVQACFANTPAGKWLSANSYRYGFVLRYPAAKSVYTGYRGEAWHYRYIGTALATELKKLDYPTLEQFFKVSGGTEYTAYKNNGSSP